jgi:hypothetical protein
MTKARSPAGLPQNWHGESARPRSTMTMSSFCGGGTGRGAAAGGSGRGSGVRRPEWSSSSAERKIWGALGQQIMDPVAGPAMAARLNISWDEAKAVRTPLAARHARAVRSPDAVLAGGQEDACGICVPALRTRVRHGRGRGVRRCPRALGHIADVESWYSPGMCLVVIWTRGPEWRRRRGPPCPDWSAGAANGLPCRTRR